MAEIGQKVRGYGGFGMLAVYNGIKMGEAYTAYKAESDVEAKKLEPVVTSAVNTLGTATWAWGIGSGNSIAQTAGPAANFVANITSAGLKYYQGDEEWRPKLASAGEMLSFTTAGVLKTVEKNAAVPWARAAAFTFAGTEFALDAPHDKALWGHAAGGYVWAVGAALESPVFAKVLPQAEMVANVVQGTGAAIVGASEIYRTAAPYWKRFMGEEPSPEAAPQPSDSEQVSLQTIPSTAPQHQRFSFEEQPGPSLNPIAEPSNSLVPKASSITTGPEPGSAPPAPSSEAPAAVQAARSSLTSDEPSPVSPAPSIPATSSTTSIATAASMPVTPAGSVSTALAPTNSAPSPVIPSGPGSIASAASGPVGPSVASSGSNPIASALSGNAPAPTSRRNSLDGSALPQSGAAKAWTPTPVKARRNSR
ncbi:hypothetical protein [Streptomyces axinellae]|uniref:hypothetical protein n=1 Tax=Streptomyces axinellae TaxID=552788 RepID=UPI0031DB307F